MDFHALPMRSGSALLGKAREAKERLHPNSRKIVLDLEQALGRLAPKPEVVITAADYYAACLPLVERTIEAMTPVMTRFEEEARAPDLAELAGIYVTGGGSELPVVGRVLRERFGRRVHRSPYASAAVAIGLAIAGDGAADFSLVDRFARTFGVFREGDAGKNVTFDPIFAPDTVLPAKHDAPLTRTRAYRAAHNVGHFRFFECSGIDSQGTPHGDMTVFGDVRFPFDARLADADDVARVQIERSASPGPRIEESYRLNEKGIVEIIIRNVDSGYERTYRLGA
jgi:molecular chaperone DnaK (HSP70)